MDLKQFSKELRSIVSREMGNVRKKIKKRIAKKQYWKKHHSYAFKDGRASREITNLNRELVELEEKLEKLKNLREYIKNTI